MDIEQQTVRAARMMSLWARNKRSIIAVEVKDYDILLEGLTPLRAGINSATQEVTIVTVNKEAAISFLKKKYKLKDKSDIVLDES